MPGVTCHRLAVAVTGCPTTPVIPEGSRSGDQPGNPQCCGSDSSRQSAPALKIDSLNANALIVAAAEALYGVGPDWHPISCEYWTGHFEQAIRIRAVHVKHHLAPAELIAVVLAVIGSIKPLDERILKVPQRVAILVRSHRKMNEESVLGH